LDKNWFWGGSEAKITQTITHGRKAIMPAWGPMLKEKGVTNVANYVKSISDNPQNQAWSVKFGKLV
jgi:cytochrome c oxidase cbb3-type subunit 3